MSIPVSQMWTVASHVIGQNIKGNKHYPLVLMLEPLFRCNLRCKGCGKVKYPSDILSKQLSLEQCINAVDECGAPIVSIAGGEPLLHHQMPDIIRALVKKKKYIYLCSNALLIEKRLKDYSPSKYLTVSIHLDGPEDEHDMSVDLPGTYQKALSAAKFAVEKGFRVTTNTTIYEGNDPLRYRQFFDDIMSLGIEGMMMSPGYSYEKASDQDHFLKRRQTYKFFRKLLYKGKKSWKFNHSPLFLEFIAGTRHLECAPWGSPTYNIFGWQVPCYLIQDGFLKTYKELIETTPWEKYGLKSGNPKCANCMLHCGHEHTAVDRTFHSLAGFVETIFATLSGPKIYPPDKEIYPHL